MSAQRFVLLATSALTAFGLGVAVSYVIPTEPAQKASPAGVRSVQIGDYSTSWTDEVSGLSPQQAPSRYLDLLNTGPGVLRGVTATVSTDIDLDTDVFVSLTSCSVPWSTGGTCAAQQIPVLVDTSLKDWSSKISLDTFEDFASGQVRYVKVSTRVPASAQRSRSGKVTYVFAGITRAEGGSSIATQGTKFGVFAAPENGQSDLQAVQDFEERTGRRASVVSSFWSWGYSPFSSASDRLAQVLDSGRTPLITWEPWVPESKDQTYSLASIIAGQHDAYITSWATGLRDLKGTVYLRPMHEANGNWYPWAGQDPAQYRQAWRHVHDLFVAAGASNVSFVYSPNIESVGTTHSLGDYYPGSDVVDVLALDGYNCLSTSWRSFSDLFTDAYNQIGALNPDAPIWIAETASCESAAGIAGAGGHTKAEWISGMLNQTGFDRLKMIVWFNADKEFDWRIDSSPAAVQAYRP